MTSPERAVEDLSAARLPRGVAGAFVLMLCCIVPFIMLAVSYEVAAREFFNLVPLWINDVTGYLLLALTFLGGAFVMARDGHTQVDIVVEHTTPAVKRRLIVLNCVLILGVALVLSAVAGFTVVDSYRRNLMMMGIIDVPRWVVLSPIFFGSVLLVVERATRLARLLRTPSGSDEA
ncbi:MAG: TRAP transporter small permease [Burkholderiales bacterium]